MAIETLWMPRPQDWQSRLKALGIRKEEVWQDGVKLSNSQLNFVQTNALDAKLNQLLEGVTPKEVASKISRLALLGSSTLTHLHAAIRVSGMRRGIWVSIYENEYGQYMQELTNPESRLHAFRPTAVLFAFDAHYLAAGFHPAMSHAECEAALNDVKERIRESWSLARQHFSCHIIHQTSIPVHPQLIGNNEHRLPGSRCAVVDRLNSELRRMADAEDVTVLALDSRVAIDGLAVWFDSGLWHRAKQEVCPSAAPMYGELVGRLLAAKQGRSYKCVVLDLDNTLWGGVVGDDGLEGLVLGQGSALGEAYVAFQEYIRALSSRGVIVAICSKNDEANAIEVFDQHPEMVLRRADVASFMANWNDKVANIRAIAEQLSIGLDSMVFVDDNPAERDLVRRELPMVAVPEISDDPSSYPQLLASAGYFESLRVTEEDKARGQHYQSNQAREKLRSSTTDLASYLSALEMQLTWRRFDKLGLQRIAQLINKTNQFNLTTRRYSSEELLDLMRDERTFGLQLRLRDRFGDSGVIAIVIGRLSPQADFLIDTWLMSCRVLGRQIESATLNLIVAEARRMGATQIIGEYIPTKKNGMVKDHYKSLGFKAVNGDPSGSTMHSLQLATYEPAKTSVDLREG